MKEKDVRIFLQKNELTWEKFMEFMVGQTISEAENGETIYWTDDVNRFVRQSNGERLINFD